MAQAQMMGSATMGTMGTMGRKKKRTMPLTRDGVLRRLSFRQRDRRASPLVVLAEIFEESQDKGRFVGDTMFWKFFEDMDVQRIYHTTSVEYRNLRLMFWETCFYVLLLILITAYAYTLQARDVYDARQQQQDYWSGCSAPGRNCDLNRVRDSASFWSWMSGEFVDRAFTQYAVDPPPVAQISVPFPDNDFAVKWSPRFVGPGLGNVLLGTVRIRQLRVEANSGCKVSQLFRHIYPDCYGTYKAAFQSRRTFAPRFAPTYLHEAFEWHPASETRQLPFSGKMGDYSGDGFTVDLPANSSNAATVIQDLYNWHWVDRATRAIMVEVSTLSTNVNVIVSTRLVFEFGPTGSVKGTAESQAGRVLFFAPSLDAGAPTSVFFMQILMLLVFAVYTSLTFFLMYKTIRGFLGERPLKKMFKSGCLKSLSFIAHSLLHYFGYGWNIVDLAILLAFLVHCGYRIDVYVAKSSESALDPEVIGHPEMFMPCSRVMMSLTEGNNALAILVMLAWLKSFKYLCMSSYFRLLVRILEQCALKLVVFSAVFLVFFLGFAMAFFTALGSNDIRFTSVEDSFLVLFFMLIDGYVLDPQWFEPGRGAVMPLVFWCYVAIIYVVLLNIFVAVVLDIYATSRDFLRSDRSASNPMAVFLVTYWNWMRGISLVKEVTDHNLKKDDLSIRLELLPGIVRRKWIEKKRAMQRVANENFAGMDLFPDEVDLQAPGSKHVDWMLPSSRLDVVEAMTNQGERGAISVYEIPPSLLRKDISREQLQRLMDEDSTLPILLGTSRAVDVIRRFRSRPQSGEADGDEPPAMAVGGGLEGMPGGGRPKQPASEAMRRLQGFVFGRVDELEKVRLDGEVPKVPQVNALTEEMSGAITDVRNQFRLELTGIIEATGALFEHLVELTQGINAMRQNHEDVIAMVRQRDAEPATR